MTRYFMGIDLGGTVTKAGIYTADGQEIKVVAQPLPLLNSKPGFCERNMKVLWSATCQVIRTTLAESKISPSSIHGVSFSAHGKGLYLVDKKGIPVRHGIVSSDSRAQPLITEWKKQGIDKLAYKYSLQQLWPSHPAALLRWIKQYEPENYIRIGGIFMVHDYIRYCMTNKFYCETTNISGSNLFNQYSGGFDPMLFSLFGIDEMIENMPSIIGSSDFSGYITTQAASVCGLKEGTPVFAGMFDVVGAALVSGIQDNTQLSAVAGTWSIATRVFNQIIPSDYPYVWGKYCIPGTYFIHEGSPTSASNLAWFINQFMPDMANCYDILNQWVIKAYDDPKDIIFFPWLYGSNFDDKLNGGFLGLKGHHKTEDMIYAIYQGIVFSHLLHQDKILQIKHGTECIRFTGGPTHSLIWMQMFCDASNLPLEIVNIEQSGCLAAAICAATGAGDYSDFKQAMGEITLPIMRLNPVKYKHEILRRSFDHFKRVATVLKKL